jgi:hypothetical protein
LATKGIYIRQNRPLLLPVLKIWCRSQRRRRPATPHIVTEEHKDMQATFWVPLGVTSHSLFWAPFASDSTFKACSRGRVKQ